MKKLFSNKYLRSALLILAGILLGWLIFHSSAKPATKIANQATPKAEIIWTCSMHPQIRMHSPGKCPICGMELIPLKGNNSSNADSGTIHMSKEALQLAQVQTSTVTIQKAVKEIRLYGKIQADERLLQTQTANISGRIEKLMVNFTGDRITKGQVLALVYSPELINAQQELLEAAKNKRDQAEIYDAAREKLIQLKLTQAQIEEIEVRGRVQNNFEIVSTTTGIVSDKRVNTGDYISKGATLFDIADLSNVWVIFDAYESDLQFIKIHDKISFSLEAFPGKKFNGTVFFIDPAIDPVTRIARVRVETSNLSSLLKPEMFATGILKASLDEYAGKIVIPSSAVLWTGKRSIVYIKTKYTDEDIFKLREIELGPSLGNSYIVLTGLKEGEQIVTQGAFSVDAASQLEGKPSMMNQK